MVFSSSDITEIGRVGRQFLEAGIPCGIRYDPPREGASAAPGHAELWVQNEEYFYQAVALYLRLDGNPVGQPLDGRGPAAAKLPAKAPVQKAAADRSRPPGMG